MPALIASALLLAATAAHRLPTPLEIELISAIREAGLGQLLDAGPVADACPGTPGCPSPLPTIAAPPHVDLAVIRLGADGRALEAAEVILDPDSPRGAVVPLDRNLAPRGLRFRRWNQERREAPETFPAFGPADDLVPDARPGRDFMEPYPASLFKLLLAFHLARRAGVGALSLDEEIPGGPLPAVEVHPVREWLDLMMTRSDNPATMAILAWLHRNGEVARMNHDFGTLGLSTLRVDGTRPEDGARWAPGEVHAGAMDVARLLWLIAGGPGVSWRGPGGRRVTSDELTPEGRALLQGLLWEQANHDVLSSGSVCGARPTGIPAVVPKRWIDGATGSEAIVNPAWRRDVRPCNAKAEVRFLHKTGLTWNYVADAGIVESLPGAPCRRYVVAIVTSAGSRFLDPEVGPLTVHPCAEEGLCISGRLAALAARIDRYMTGASASDGKRGGCAPLPAP